MGGANQHCVTGDAGAFFNLRPCIKDDFPRNQERIEPDDCRPLFAIVKDSDADLAGIMKAAVITLPIAPGLLGADRRGDVSLGKACLNARCGR